MSHRIPGAPAEVAAALERLTTDLKTAGGINLAGVILYGGLARGRFRPGKSDVNIVVLLHDLSGPALTAIAPALRTARRSAGVSPMVLSPVEVVHTADAFPTKFLDIKNHRIVLAGSDPFQELNITREQVRLRTEQELRNLLLRLRQHYVLAGDDSIALGRAMASAARTFALRLASLLQLSGAEVPEDDRSQAIFDAAASAFALDRDALISLAELRHTPPPLVTNPELYLRILTAIERATAIAEGMRETAQ